MTDGGSGQGVAAELAAMRGEFNTSLARIEGRIDLLVHMSSDASSELVGLDSRIVALEARRVPWALVTVLSGVMSALVALCAFLVQL